MSRKLIAPNRQFFQPATREEKQTLSITELPSLEVGVNPMDVDRFSMGTFFGQDWQILYGSEFQDKPLSGIYLHNNKTGQRHAIHIDPAKPKVKKLINLRGVDSIINCDSVKKPLHAVIARVFPNKERGYEAFIYVAPLPRESGPRCKYEYRQRDLESARYLDENEHKTTVGLGQPFYYYIFNGIGIHVSTTKEDLVDWHETFKNCDVVIDEEDVVAAINGYLNLIKENEKW